MGFLGGCGVQLPYGHRKEAYDQIFHTPYAYLLARACLKVIQRGNYIPNTLHLSLGCYLSLLHMASLIYIPSGYI